MRLRHTGGAIGAALLTASCCLAVENEFAAALLDRWDGAGARCVIRCRGPCDQAVCHRNRSDATPVGNVPSTPRPPAVALLRHHTGGGRRDWS
jgi:hypothetical protein